MELREPDCELGYPVTQLQGILGARMSAFREYLRGQTCAICDGRRFVYETGESVDSGCGPHGMVAYKSCLENFLRRSETH